MFKKYARGKRGDVSSILVVIIILFLIASIALVFSSAFLDALAEMKEQPQIASSNSSMFAITTVEEHTIPYLDFLFAFAFVAVLVGLIISSIYISTHPAFVPIFIIILIIAVLIAGVLSNVYSELAQEEVLSSTAAQFTFTGVIMDMFPILTLLTGVITIVVLYGKGKTEDYL